MKTRRILKAAFSVLIGWTALQAGCVDLAGLGGYFPASDLYDPTDIIQDVIDYRQDVMEWSANAWDEYILQ